MALPSSFIQHVNSKQEAFIHPQGKTQGASQGWSSLPQSDSAYEVLPTSFDRSDSVRSIASSGHSVCDRTRLLFGGPPSPSIDFVDVASADSGGSGGSAGSATSLSQHSAYSNAIHCRDGSSASGSVSAPTLSTHSIQGSGAGKFVDDAASSSHSLSSDVSSSGEHEQSRFRCNAKRFAITYPQCDLTREQFSLLFKKKFERSRYIQFKCSRESHKDGHFHFHVFLNYSVRKDIKNSRHFDLELDGVVYHPNVQAARNEKDWVQYISKGDDVGEMEWEPEVFSLMDHSLGLREKRYKDHLFSQRYLEAAKLKSIKYPIVVSACDMDDYVMNPPDVKVKCRSWWIVAPPDAGKTRWINQQFSGQKVYCPRVGAYPFEGYDGEDIIVYDDRETKSCENGKGVTFEELAAVTNTYFIPTPIYGQVRFTTQNWPIGKTRNVIFLTNFHIVDSFESKYHDLLYARFITISNPIFSFC